MYCPGDVVEGWLYLEAYCSLRSRAIRVELSHTSRCAWYVQSSGDERIFVGERVHFRAVRTVLGALFSTDTSAAVASLVGGAVAFDAAQGEVLVPLSTGRGSLLALRVLLVGGLCLAACAVDADALLSSGSKSTELPMVMPSGSRATAAVTVSAALSAADDDNPDAPGRQGLRRVLLRVQSVRV